MKVRFKYNNRLDLFDFDPLYSSYKLTFDSTMFKFNFNWNVNKNRIQKYLNKL